MKKDERKGKGDRNGERFNKAEGKMFEWERERKQNEDKRKDENIGKEAKNIRFKKQNNIGDGREDV